jgi:hypothetical protein
LCQAGFPSGEPNALSVLLMGQAFTASHFDPSPISHLCVNHLRRLLPSFHDFSPTTNLEGGCLALVV